MGINSITTEMNKLSSALLLIACAYAFVTVTSAFDADDFNDDVFDVFTEEEGLVQTPAATLKKELAAAKAAQKAANAKTNKLNKKLQSKMHKASKKAIVKASAKSIGNRIHAAFQGRLVKHFTKLAKKQARKNKYLRRKQRQAKVSATHALSRNHIKMVKYQAKVLQTFSRVAASQKKMLKEKAATAKFFANQIKAVKKAGKKAAKRTARRLRMAKARMTHIKNKIEFNKKLAKSIMKKWGQLKAKSESKRKAIEATYARRVKALGAQNARNQKKFNMAVAKGQAYFAAKAKNNAMKAAMAAARLKLQEKVNKIAEKSTKRRAAKLHRKESGLKAAAKRKELTAKKKAHDKLKESRQKEANHKKMVANEADTKYKRKQAHAAAMEKDAQAAASEKSTKAAKKAGEEQAKVDASIKECGADECLKGAKCVKTGAKTGLYLDQVGFVKCTKKKPQNMLGDWAGSPFKESDFPEAHYKEPKFTMPVMPGFSSWGISKHFDKVQAAQKAAIKKAAKHDTKAVEMEQQDAQWGIRKKRKKAFKHASKLWKKAGKPQKKHAKRHGRKKHLMKHLKKHAKRHGRKKHHKRRRLR